MLPLHHRLFLALRGKLLAGEFPPEAALPGEHQLAADFGVSRATVRRVLDRLAQEGLIDRRPGAGTFPVARGIDESDESTLSYYDFIALMSHTYDDELLEFSYLPTPPLISSREPAFGPVVLKVSRLRRHEGRPLHLSDSFLPVEVAPFVTRERVGNRTLLEILAEHDIHAAKSEFRVGAVAAGAGEAQALAVDIGAPLVHATRLSRTATGRPIEFTLFLSVADLFGYSFTFDGRTARPEAPADAAPRRKR